MGLGLQHLEIIPSLWVLIPRRREISPLLVVVIIQRPLLVRPYLAFLELIIQQVQPIVLLPQIEFLVLEMVLAQMWLIEVMP